MYVDNYWIMKAYAEKTTPPGNYQTVDIGLKNKSGSPVSIYVVGGNTSHPFYSSPWNTAAESRLCVGTGNTAAASTDYALVDDVTSDFTSVAYTVNSSSDDGIETVFTVSGTNNTGADIVIKEIGIETRVSDTSNNPFYILTAREVLKNPYTVEAGKGFILTVKAKTA